LLEGIFVKASVVAVVVQDFDSVLSCVLFKIELGSKIFGLLIVKLGVDKAEAAEVSTKTVVHL
jgi:hypothetical protein